MLRPLRVASVNVRILTVVLTVGRPGLDPGTLGLKGICELLLWVGLAAHIVCLQGNALSLVGLVSWCRRNMRPKMRPVWAGAVTQGRTW
jgi:hypothetical protein